MDTAKDVNWCLVLKEYADANKCTLQYYEMSESGKPNIPTFDVKVRIAGDDKREGAGRGTTKKAAKAQAAQALMVLVDRDNGHPESRIPVNAYRDQSGDDNDLENDVENIVGELQVGRCWLSYPMLCYPILSITYNRVTVRFALFPLLGTLSKEQMATTVIHSEDRGSFVHMLL